MYEDSRKPADTHEYDPREVRRSFRLLSVDAVLFLFGLAFLDSSTVLPSFLSTLTKSSIVIGAIAAIRPAGSFLPQLWTAHYLRNRTRHKSFLMKVASISRIMLVLYAVLMLLVGPSDKTLMLCGFVVMYAALWFSEGMAGVPWMDLLAKNIPERMRGRLMGSMNFFGGVCAIFAGIVVSRLLSSKGPDYPMNYTILIAIAAVFMTLSFIVLIFVREPEGVCEEHEGDFFDYVKKLSKTLAGHDQLKRLIVIQILLGFFGMALPFYILYAKEAMISAEALWVCFFPFRLRAI